MAGGKGPETRPNTVHRRPSRGSSPTEPCDPALDGAAEASGKGPETTGEGGGAHAQEEEKHDGRNSGDGDDGRVSTKPPRAKQKSLSLAAVFGRSGSAPMPMITSQLLFDPTSAASAECEGTATAKPPKPSPPSSDEDGDEEEEDEDGDEDEDEAKDRRALDAVLHDGELGADLALL